MAAQTEKPTVLHVSPRKTRAEFDSVSTTETMIKGSSRSFSPFSEITMGDSLIVSTDVLDSCENKTITSATPTQKKIQRAERFGVPLRLSEEEKRSSRAQRFGSKAEGHGVIDVQKNPEEEKRKARAERFGLPASSAAAGEEVKKKARLARFSSVPRLDSAEEEEKRISRAKRFSNKMSESQSEVRDATDDP